MDYYEHDLKPTFTVIAKVHFDLLHFNEDLESFVIRRSLECRISVHHVREFEICV